jgi:choloylglycine hydrolase
MKKLLLCSLCLIQTLTLFQKAQSCTDIKIQAKDGSVVVARSMEFEFDIQSKLNVVEKGQKKLSHAPKEMNGIEWTSKYKIAYLDGFGLDGATDGMNEKGLSVEILYMPGYAKYQDEQAQKHPDKALSILDLGVFILGNFKTTDEVKKALQEIYVWGEPHNNFIFPIHLAVNDSEGNSTIVEWTDKGLNFNDNKVGVLTNSPYYDWHTINLNNYLNLNPINPPQKLVNGETFSPAGQGAGFVGLPGDWSPPSRFIRAATINSYAQKPKNAQEALLLGSHLINSFDIPKGIMRDKDKNDPSYGDYTPWVVLKDLNNKVIYFRHYSNPNFYSVDLSKVIFEKGQSKKTISIQQPYAPNDLSNQLQ